MRKTGEVNLTNFTSATFSTTRETQCQSLIESIITVSSQVIWFQTLLITLGIVGIIANYLVIRAIVVLRQNANQSIRLLMYLSMIDMSSSFNNIIRFLFGRQPQWVNCHVARFIHIFGLWTIYSSIYMFAITALDRYFKIYMDDYEQKFNPVRFRVAMVCYLILTCLQTTMAAYFNLTYYVGYGATYTTTLNIIIVLLTAILYVKSTIQLKKYKRENESFAESIQSIINITQIYVYLFMINPVCLLIISFMIRQKFLTPFQENMTKQIATILPSITGSINAIYFFLTNKEAKPKKILNCTRDIWLKFICAMEARKLPHQMHESFEKN